jgi:hypothetical protein
MARGPSRTGVVAQPPATLAHAAERDAVAAAAGPLARRRARATAAGTVVTRGVVVVAQAEEPDEPDDQQADIEYAEADHEDPSLGGHDPMVPLSKRKVKAGFPDRAPAPTSRSRSGRRERGQRCVVVVPCDVDGRFVGVGLGTNVAL